MVRIAWYELSVAIVALLAGCGGSQPPIGANLGSGHSASFQRQQATSGEDLIYVTPLSKSLEIYSYPAGQLISRVNDLDDAFALCGDASGDVFIEEHGGLFKYAHGSTTPITEINGYYGGYACSVDPASGNLAITGNGFVDVFPGQQAPAVRYNYTAIPYITSAAYDNDGNLFVAGYGLTSGSRLLLAKLAKGGSALVGMAVPPKLRYGAIQWDGQYIAIVTAGFRARAPEVQQLAVTGSSVQIVHSAKLKPGQADAPVGINFAQQRNVMVMQVGHHTLTFWKYPNGGRPEQTIDLGKGNQNLAGWPVFSAGSTSKR